MYTIKSQVFKEPGILLNSSFKVKFQIKLGASRKPFNLLKKIRRSPEKNIPIVLKRARLGRALFKIIGIFFLKNLLRIKYEIKPGIFEEKRGIAALLFKNSGFYFIFDPSRKT